MFKKKIPDIDINNLYVELLQINPENYNFEDAFMLLYGYFEKLEEICIKKYKHPYNLNDFNEYKDSVILIFDMLSNYEDFEKYIQFEYFSERISLSKIYNNLNIKDFYVYQKKESMSSVFEGLIDSLMKTKCIKERKNIGIGLYAFNHYAKEYYAKKHEKEIDDLLKLFVIKINKEEKAFLEKSKKNFEKNFNLSLIEEKECIV